MENNVVALVSRSCALRSKGEQRMTAINWRSYLCAFRIASLPIWGKREDDDSFDIGARTLFIRQHIDNRICPFLRQPLFRKSGRKPPNQSVHDVDICWYVPVTTPVHCIPNQWFLLVIKQLQNVTMHSRTYPTGDIVDSFLGYDYFVPTSQADEEQEIDSKVCSESKVEWRHC